MSCNYTYKKLEDSKCRVKSNDKNQYSVYSTSIIEPGDVIEECVATETDLVLEKLIEFGINENSAFFTKSMPFIKEDGLTGISFVGGNFNSYERCSKGNAIYQYDIRFGIVTIRAVRKIERAEKIVLVVDTPSKDSTKKETNTDMKKKIEKKKGCGCAEKAALRRKILTEAPEGKVSAPTNHPKVPPKILRDKPKLTPFSPEVTETPKFKSMVNEQSLKTIKVDK